MDLKTYRHIVAETSKTYEMFAERYAAATENYAAYPGLEQAVRDFGRALPPARPVLDLGCGGGRDGRLLSGLGHQVVEADISMNMLRIARRRADERLASFLRVDMLRLPFGEDRFAGVWASASLLHVPRDAMPEVLGEILRVLAPGGLAAVSMREGSDEYWRQDGTLPGRRWFTLVAPEDFADEMLARGFRDVRIVRAGRPGWFIALGCK